MLLTIEYRPPFHLARVGQKKYYAKMKDILFIGGPEKGLQGVDRVDDDVVSVLSAEAIYDRKWVVVWPTTGFLALPPDTQALSRYLNETEAVDAAAAQKDLLPTSQWDLRTPEEYRAEASADMESIKVVTEQMALSKAVKKLAKLQLAVAGGLNVVVVVSPGTPLHSLCWTRLIDGLGVAEGVPVKEYDSKSSLYGILNSVKDWAVDFEALTGDAVKLGSLLPLEKFGVHGRELSLDQDWFQDVDHFMDAEGRITTPVISRFGAVRAVQVDVGRGRLLVVPPPDKIKNFIIAMKAGGGASEVDSPKVREKKPAKLPDEYMTRKEVAECLKISERSVDRWCDKGDLKSIKVKGEVRILKASVEALLKDGKSK